MLRSLSQGMACLRVHGCGSSQSGALREAVKVSGAAARALPQPLLQHVRTTFILKRKERPHLVKGFKAVGSRKLKARDFLYKLVEDTNAKKKENIKLLLKTSVEGLGSRGEVVEVRPHKARKELLLPGLAVYASPENLEKYSKLMVDMQQEDQPSSPFALSTAKLLSKSVFYLSMNKSQPWVVEPWHIRVAFRKASVMVPEEAITMPPQPITGPDFSLQDKEFVVKVKINNKEEAAVRFRLNHYTPDPLDRLPTRGPYWDLPSEPLFPEQADLIDQLNKLYRKPDSTEEEEMK